MGIGSVLYGIAGTVVGAFVLTGILTTLGGRSADVLVAFFQRTGSLRGGRLHKYRRAVLKNYALHPLGFDQSSTIDIQKVYVPLQAVNGDRRDDIYVRIREQKRSVITGPAGAGKSVLLKSSMIIWADPALNRVGKRDPVPVLIDLHRSNSSAADIPQLVCDELTRNQISRPRPFVEKILRDGRLRLFLDGLDEVDSRRQEAVAQMLRDFSQAYPDCQMVVTCRDTAYRGQLSPEFTCVVSIADFDDAGVSHLLRAWPGLGREDVESLASSLRNNPALMRLARSPLLLTMIAYLYVHKFAKSGRMLPASRATFYEMAIKHLLGRDQELSRSASLSVYEVSDKLPVLERIALASQMATAGTDGRRAIPRAAALATVQAVLPEINLETNHARPLFDEIVDRSQLLLPSDRSRTEFSFRHGTLQEYLAARALIDKPAELLRQYKRDPDAWREVVRLWCNSSDHDCTTIVQEVMRDSVPRDRILGLQCVADARRISDRYSAEVVDSFVAMLGHSEPDHAAVVASLGSVIASGGPRGRELMSILISKIRGASTRNEQQAAMLALSASGHPEAAEALAPLAASNEDARSALRSMGELIVPVLARRAEASELGALDDLALIATPAAAEALVAALYRDDRSATRAAWLLVQLLRNPGIEDSIRYAKITVDTDRPYYDWIWRPFARPDDGALECITGRIAYLLDKGEETAMPETIRQIDERIALPVAGMALAQSSRHRRGELAQLVPSGLRSVIRKVELDNVSRNLSGSTDIHSREWATWNDVSRILAGSAASPNVYRDAAHLATRLMEVMQIDRPHRLLVGRMPWPVAARLLGATSSDRFAKLQPRDWLEVEHQFQPAKTLGSILGRSLAVALATVLLVGTILRVPDVLGHSFTHAVGSWLNVIGLGLCIMVVAFTVVMLFFDYDGILGEALLFIGIGTFVTIVLFDAEAVVRLLAIAVGTIGIFVVIGFGVAAFAIAGWRSARRSRQMANPFRHILHAQDRSIASRRSILAY